MASARGLGIYGVLQSAGLLFFAFAGYARIATMGEEVRDPQHTIPRAIVIALAIAVAVYAVVAVAVLLALGPDRLATSRAPLADAVAAGGWAWAVPVVVVGGAAAALGALLALIAGVGRTTLAMARHADLPRWLAAVHPRYRTPHRAEITIAVIVSLLVLTVDLRGAIGFSSFGVLRLLPDRQPLGLHPTHRAPPVPPLAAGPRGRRLPAARGHPALAGGCGRARGVRGRRRLPRRPAGDVPLLTRAWWPWLTARCRGVSRAHRTTGWRSSALDRLLSI